jgi:hypothetical protein
MVSVELVTSRHFRLLIFHLLPAIREDPSHSGRGLLASIQLFHIPRGIVLINIPIAY